VPLFRSGGRQTNAPDANGPKETTEVTVLLLRKSAFVSGSVEHGRSNILINGNDRIEILKPFAPSLHEKTKSRGRPFQKAGQIAR
jgi:hypothetical protein